MNFFHQFDENGINLWNDGSNRLFHSIHTMSQPKIKEFIKTHILSWNIFTPILTKKLLFMTMKWVSIPKKYFKQFSEYGKTFGYFYHFYAVILIDGGHCTSTYTAYSSLFTPTNSDPLRPCKADCLRADLISRPDTE